MSVKAPKPPSSRNVRSPSSIRAASRRAGRSVAVELQRRRHVIGRVVLLDEPVDVRLGRRLDGRDEVADAIAVDPDAELDLGLDLVALGDRDLAHVVAEAGEPEPPELVDTAGGPGPAGDAVDDLRIPPVADDRGPAESQATSR